MGIIIKNGVMYGGGSTNVQADWTETNVASDAYIQHKPTLGTAAGKDSTTTILSGGTDLPTDGTVYSYVTSQGFITKAVNDLTNYYTTSQTYTKTEVNALISAIPKFNIEVVDSLLIPDPSPTTIYLLLNQTAQTQNLYTEYIYVIPETGEPHFEKLGEQTIDLSQYYTSAQIDTLLAGYATINGHGILTPSGSALTQRANLKFSGGVDVTDDSTNGATVVNIKEPIEITYANYQLLTPEQIAANDYLITDYPGGGGGSSSNSFVLSDTLDTGDTTITFTDNRLGENTFVFAPATSNGITPTACSYNDSTHSITYTFPAQSSDVVVSIVAIN